MKESLNKEKQKQSQLVQDQVKVILKKYDLTVEQKNTAAKDIADVLLTSWDLKLSNMDYVSTWLNEKNFKG
ncbi:hypothetical protein [Pseudoalteromonas sp. PB2-1]|uniref:hypothetical protein n=1 Tax=Pseudoalteromonas sp. PB2-1 TaxID=2907242 RepID=UPI003865FF30